MPWIACAAAVTIILGMAHDPRLNVLLAGGRSPLDTPIETDKVMRVADAERALLDSSARLIEVPVRRSIQMEEA